MPSSYQVVLWKQESFVVLRPLHIEFFRNLLGRGGGMLEETLRCYSFLPGSVGNDVSSLQLFILNSICWWS
jgi:hypothetical protein